MTYVFPMMLAGLVVAGVPILLHLIMRQKPKRVRFPAFRFLVQRHRRNQRKLRLRHLLLLAMRVLLIAGICFALSLPYLGVNRRGRPLAAVFVFDTSYSMGYKNSEGQSRLDQAIKRSLKLLDDPELPAETQVAVFDSGLGVAEFTANLEKARDDIRKLRLRPDNASVTQSLQKAFALLDKVAKKNDIWSRKALRFVAVFSDRTKNAWNDNALPELYQIIDFLPPDWEGLRQARSAIPSLVTALKTLREKVPPPDGVDYAEQSLLASLEKLQEKLRDVSADNIPLRSDAATLLADVRRQGRTLRQTLQPLADSSKTKKGEYDAVLSELKTVLNHLRGFQAAFIDVGVESPIDLALLSLELPRGRQSFASDENIVFRANLRATGKTFQSAIMFQHENKTYRKPITLPKGGDDSILFELNGKQLQLSPGTYQVKVQSLTRDRLAFNNTLYATIAVRRPKQILILADDPKAADDFQWALEAVTLSRLFQFRPQVVPISDFPKKLTPKDIGKFDAVYLFQAAQPSSALWKALDNYVAKGGSLAVVPPGKELNSKSYDDPIAQKLLPGKFHEVVAHADAKKKIDFDDTVVGAIWDIEKTLIANHPLLKRFAQWREANVDLVKQPRSALRYWNVQPVKGKSMVLVRYADEKQRPALLERIQTENRGKVVQFTLPLDLRSPPWHNYLEKLNSFYLVLTSLTTNYLAADDGDAKLNFITGDSEPVVALPSDKQYSTYTLRGADLFPISLQPGIKWKTLPMAVEPFNYTLDGFPQPGAKGVPLAQFSVNMPPAESDLSRIEPSRIEAVLGGGSLLRAEYGKLGADAVQGFYSDSLELFPWLMIAVLVLLALENLLSNLFYGKKQI